MAFDDLTVYIEDPDGAYKETDETGAGNVTRALFGVPSVSPLRVTPAIEEMFDGFWDENGPTESSPIEIAYVIKGTVDASVTDQDERNRERLDDWRTLQREHYNPFGGPKWWRADRENVTPVTLSSVIRVFPLDAPTAVIKEAKGGMVDESYIVDGGSHYYYVVRLAAPRGLFRERIASSDATIVATTGGDSATLANGGLKPAVCRITVSAVTGSPTVLTVAVDGVDQAVITKSSAFAANDYVSFGFETPGLTESSASTITVGVGGKLSVPVTTPSGSSSVTVTTNSGTADILLEWYQEFGSW